MEHHAGLHRGGDIFVGPAAGVFRGPHQVVGQVKVVRDEVVAVLFRGARLVEILFGQGGVAGRFLDDRDAAVAADHPEIEKGAAEVGLAQPVVETRFLAGEMFLVGQEFLNGKIAEPDGGIVPEGKHAAVAVFRGQGDAERDAFGLTGHHAGIVPDREGVFAAPQAAPQVSVVRRDGEEGIKRRQVRRDADLIGEHLVAPQVLRRLDIQVGTGGRQEGGYAQGKQYRFVSHSLRI